MRTSHFESGETVCRCDLSLHNSSLMKFWAILFVLLFGIVPLTSAAPPAEKAEGASDSAPQFGKWGFDSEGADLKTKPGDDFFRYANGAWLDRVKIPADKPAYSLRLAMSDTVEQRLARLDGSGGKEVEHEAGDDRGQSRRVLQIVHGREADRESRRLAAEG